MSNHTDSLALGSPRFRDAALAQRAQDQGMLAAWREALSRDVRAAAGIEGEFAIGLRELNGRSVLAVDRLGSRMLCYRIHGGQPAQWMQTHLPANLRQASTSRR